MIPTRDSEVGRERERVTETEIGEASSRDKGWVEMMNEDGGMASETARDVA